MKPENRKAYLDHAKRDYKMFSNGKRLKNWWEGEGITLGDGKLKEKITEDISDGVDDYNHQLEEDKAEYNKLLMESINE